MAKKITAKKIMKAINADISDFAIITCGEGEAAIEIPVKKYLSLEDRIAFVNTVIDIVFIANEDGELVYVPALEDFARAYATISFFTPVEVPEDGEAAWEFISRTNLHREIRRVAEAELKALGQATYNAIKFRRKCILKRSKLDDVLDNIASVAAAVKEKTDGMDMSQILDYLDKANPELRNQLEEFVKSQISEDLPTE